jgi:predicted DCC family thiol-disulfide oxidoreductase YuxK
MSYHVVYDGNCNLCVTFTKLLEQFDRGELFDYIPMQDTATLQQFEITERDCNLGMILIDGNQPEKRWQGSNAAEEIVKLLPLGDAFIAAYRSIPGMKWLGDTTYEQVRDNRYSWFGRTDTTYYSSYPFGCQ